jgi:DNA-binding beta-propeller fold protein YncE
MKSRTCLAGIAVLAVALAGSAPLSGQRAAAPLTGGNGTLYIGGYPNVIWIIDEATERVVGTLQTKSGIPRRLSLSRDQKRFYNIDATNEFVEVLDIASKTTVDSFRLTEGNKRVRIASLEPDPQNKYLMMITRTATKARDHVEIGPSELQQFDLATHKIVRTVPWPDGQERDQANLLFSPDGKLLYFLADEILIFETQNFTQVDKWDLSNFEEGLGQVSVSFGGFGGLDTTNDEPGFLTTTLTVEDPVQHRRMVGVARINLVKKEMDFYTVGPAGGVNFVLAPDRKHAYGLESAVGRYQFWTVDLDQRRVISRTEFEGRPRMSLKTSTNGKVLYIYNAGNTIDLYDAATYKYMRTITLDGDVTTGFFVVPKQGASSAK